MTESQSNDPALSSAAANAFADQIVQAFDDAVLPLARTVAKLTKGDFELDGLHMNFMRITGQDGAEVNFTAPIGYLPYTASADAKRAALMHIVAAGTRLRHARFGLDNQGRIMLTGKTPLKQDADDTDVLCALLDFYQEARPFLGLIAKNL